MAKRSPDRKRVKDEIRKRQIAPRSSSEGKGSKKRQSRRPKEVTIDDLQVEYAYVLKDLRRIFILAGVMFVLLIAANILFPLLLA